MATSRWNPFGVSFTLEANAGTVTRTSATTFTVVIDASWKMYYSGNTTTYGMDVSSGDVNITLNKFTGSYHKSGSGTLTGTYSISGNAASTQTIAVTFRNYNNDNGNSATSTINLSVSVPAWTSYTISYNANGGSGAPSAQTKWKDQALTLSTTKPTRTGYSFQGWATSASGSVAYASGASYTTNASVTLYAVWKANTYTVSYNANGGSGAPSSQTKTYGVTLTLSSTKPTRTNYNFKGWGTSASATTVSYNAGGSYTANASITLYAIWELAYTKPRITGLSVTRCNSSGTAQVDGTYALVKFSWACDRTISAITIDWKLATASSYTSSASVSASGTSGTISTVVGSGGFLTTNSYTIRAVVRDSIDSSNQTITLSSMTFSIHAKPGGTGIAFGKMHEANNCVDLGWNIELNGHQILDSSSSISGDENGLNALLSSMKVHSAKQFYFGGCGDTTLDGLGWFIGTMYKTDDSYATAIAYNYYNNSTVRRSKYGGTWQPWEWINPRMTLNVEYRTIERWEGEPVYTMFYSGGASATSLSISIPSGAKRVVRYNVWHGNNVLPIGDFNKTTYYANCYYASGSIVYFADSKSDGYGNGNTNLRVQVWYTK